MSPNVVWRQARQLQHNDLICWPSGETWRVSAVTNYPSTGSTRLALTRRLDMRSVEQLARLTLEDTDRVPVRAEPTVYNERDI